MSGYVLQMQTLSKPSKATNTYIQELISMMTALTLMRTQREKGRVTMTSSQEITKSSQPHAPIPESPPVWLSSVSGSETSTFLVHFRKPGRNCSVYSDHRDVYLVLTTSDPP